MKGVAVLGATGSIGASALAVLSQHPERFRPIVLTAHRNATALAGLAQRWGPEQVVLVDAPLPSDLPSAGRWSSGRAALLEAVTRPDVDIVLNALVGAAGLEPTIAALRAALLAHDPLRLAALTPLVTIGGSLVAGLALAEDAFAADALWDAVSLDELYQERRWGADSEAQKARARREADWHHAARFLSLLGD